MVYYAYIDLENNTSEIFHNGEIDKLENFRICDVINMSRKTICFVSSIKVVIKMYPGGDVLGGDYSKLGVSDPLEYNYGNCTFRSFFALFGGNSTKHLTKMFPDCPISVSMFKYIESLGDPNKVKYTLAYHAKKLFYEPIENELWDATKNKKHYYYDMQTYDDMYAQNKGGVLCREKSHYHEDVLMYDIKTAFMSVVVNDNKFPVGQQRQVKGTNDYKIKVLKKCLKDGEWVKVVFDGKEKRMARYYDCDSDKTAMEYWNFHTAHLVGRFEEYIEILKEKDFRIYTSTETNYLEWEMRNQTVLSYNKKQEYKKIYGKESFCYFMEKTKIDMIYGKAIQRYEFEDVYSLQDHYRGAKKRNYMTPEFSNHCSAKIEYEIIKAYKNCECVYYDTDGVKVKNTPQAVEYFKRENERIMEANRRSGFETDIGTWDFEGHATRLLVFGPKVYCYEVDGEFTIKTAGMQESDKQYIIGKIKGDRIDYLRRNGLLFATRKWKIENGKAEIWYTKPGLLKGDLQ